MLCTCTSSTVAACGSKYLARDIVRRLKFPWILWVIICTNIFFRKDRGYAFRLQLKRAVKENVCLSEVFPKELFVTDCEEVFSKRQRYSFLVSYSSLFGGKNWGLFSLYGVLNWHKHRPRRALNWVITASVFMHRIPLHFTIWSYEISQCIFAWFVKLCKTYFYSSCHIIAISYSQLLT